MLKIQPFSYRKCCKSCLLPNSSYSILFLHFVQIFSLYQLQIPETVPDSIMEHIGRNMICQFLDLRGSISHSNLGGCIFKHSQVIVAVSEYHSIFPRNIKQAYHCSNSHSFVKALGNKLDGISNKRAAALMTDDIIILT